MGFELRAHELKSAVFNFVLFSEGANLSSFGFQWRNIS